MNRRKRTNGQIRRLLPTLIVGLGPYKARERSRQCRCLLHLLPMVKPNDLNPMKCLIFFILARSMRASFYRIGTRVVFP